jgi:transposase
VIDSGSWKPPSPPPDDVEALKALEATMTRRAEEAEQNAATATAQLVNAMAHQSAIEALIAHPKLQIAKLNHVRCGPSAERSRRLLDQMELQLEELKADAAEDDLIAEEAAAKATTVTRASSRFNWPISASLPKSPDTCLASCRFHKYNEC